jgi:hypothetical protein
LNRGKFITAATIQTGELKRPIKNVKKKPKIVATTSGDSPAAVEKLYTKYVSQVGMRSRFALCMPHLAGGATGFRDFKL